MHMAPNSRQRIDVSAGTAFKTGFFFTLGAAVAGLIVGLVYFVVFVVVLGSVFSTMLPQGLY